MRYRVMNLTRKTQLASAAARADSFLGRFRGLMGVKDLPAGQGLHIAPCNSIHTFFMKMAIDALFLDTSNQVVGICHALRPWRLSGVHFEARSVLELPAGVARTCLTEVGDFLSFESID